MTSYFRDFTKPVKIIFDRLVKKMEVSGAIGATRTIPSPSKDPEYDLAEYPCKIIRDNDNKVIELQYGTGFDGDCEWKQDIVRDSSGIVTSIKETKPFGDGTIVLDRDSTGKVTEIDYE